jgi:hypothetical protein
MVMLVAAISPAQTESDDSLGFHEDYYLGFSQGVYYGLMLGGVGYEAAWCMKGELDYTGAAIGSGVEFQRKMQQLLDTCQERSGEAMEN